MNHWRGKWALITGASAGIGWELARQLAVGGANLVLTARRRDRLEQLAAELRAKHGVAVEVWAADLAKPNAAEEIFAFTKGNGIEVELLINNAGFGMYGEFRSQASDRLLEMAQVNVSAVIHLTRLYLPGMIERRRGDILIVASTAAFQGVPYLSAYSATKAFDLIFAEGLAQEVKSYGVRVCALCPGTTETEFHQVAAEPDRVFRHSESAEKVARTGLRALARGKHYVISGTLNFLQMQSERLAPRRLVTHMAARIMRPPE